MRFRIISPVVLFTTLLLITACKNGFDNYLQKAISLRDGGDADGAVALIEKGILENAPIVCSGPPYPACNGNVLFHPKGARIELLHPVKVSLESPEDTRTVSRDEKTGIIAAGGKGLIIYSNNGRIIDNPDISASKDGVVRACAWADSSLLFYSDRRLYTYVPSTGEVSPLSRDESFPPPFTGQFYTASIEISGSVAVISAGIAGRYNISAINLTGGAVLFKNRTAASGSVHIDGKEISTVTGSAGRWNITVLSFNGAFARSPLTFTDLSNIAFFTDGLLYENDKGLVCSSDTKTPPVRVPGTLRLYGQCGEYALLMKDDSLHLVEAASLFSNITRGRAAAPGLFAQ